MTRRRSMLPPHLGLRHRQHSVLLGAWLLATLAAGCNVVLGFESATLDPLGKQADGGGGEGGADSGPQSVCEELCATVLDACPAESPEGPLAVYDAQLTCERQCALLPPGDTGDQQGNSAECRLSQVKIARDFPGERANACPAAGPGGDGVCGSNCEGYCTLLQAECGTFEDVAQCLEACKEVPDLGGFDISIIEGDTLQCRLYHLQVAVVSPLNHCPHAAGGFPCAAK